MVRLYGRSKRGIKEGGGSAAAGTIKNPDMAQMAVDASSTRRNLYKMLIDTRIYTSFFKNYYFCK